MALSCCVTATVSSWARSSSVLEPSDDAATHWRAPENALSYPFRHSRGLGVGLLNCCSLKRSQVRGFPHAGTPGGSGGGLATATNRVRMRVSLVYIGIIVGMVAVVLAI